MSPIRATLCCLLSFIILHAYAAAEPARTRLPPRLSSDIDQIIPSATLATESPIVFYSEHPALATSYLAAYSSLVVNNPTFFPSAANSFGDVAFSAPTAYAFSEVRNALPSSLVAAETTNPAAYSSGFLAGVTGGASWFANLPSNVQTFVTEYAAPITPTTVIKTVTASPLLPPVSKTTATSSGSPTATGNASSGLSTGAKAGIGAGVGVAVLIAIVLLICFCLRRRKSKKNKTTEVAQRPEMAPGVVPAGGYAQQSYGQQPNSPMPAYASGVPSQQQQYYNEQPKYDQNYGGGAPVQSGPYQPAVYQPAGSPPPQHQSGYYGGSPPQQSLSPHPPAAGYYGNIEKSPTGTSAGGMSPGIGEGTISSAGGHRESVGTAVTGQHGAPSELAGRTSVESTRHEMP